MPAGIYRKFLLALFLLLMLPVISYAQVSKIVFTTEPQTVKPGEISGTITVQLQDSAGSSYKATETVDVEFLSSSASGEFLSPSSENAVTKIISTGSANKNFRYRDSTKGTFTLTVKATGRTSGEVWNANQIITISDSASASTTTEESSTANSTSVNQSSSSSGLSSSHYGAVSLSSLKTLPGFEVSAGRDRLGVAGSPLEFEVETNLEYKNNSVFVWNFGDGSEGVGDVVSHTYLYPGEYALMLNVSGPKDKAVSRANVKIINPDFAITHASNERVEITNNTKNEASLFGRVLVAGGKIFAFPKDTIIKSGQKISFGANVTGLNLLKQSGVVLLVVGTELRPQKIMAKIEEQRLEKIAQVNNQLSALRQQLAVLSNQQKFAKSTEIAAQSVAGGQVAEELVESENNNESQTALVIDAVAPEESSGIIDRWLQTLKHFFFRTQ